MSISFDFDYPPLVVDNGSGTCKAGIAGEDAPRIAYPTVVGTPKYDRAMVGIGNCERYYGDRAQWSRGMLLLQHPIERGIINSWDDMNRIWFNMFRYEMRRSFDNRPILMTEPCFNPLVNREKMTQVVFESFESPAFYVATQAILAMYASGRNVGVVIDSGEGVTDIVPIYEGYALRHAIKRVVVAGGDITDCLTRILHDSGYNLSTSAERETVRDMKEKLCYIAEDFNAAMATAATSSSIDSDYELPDGHIVTIGDQRFRAPECIFQPHLLGTDSQGIHHMLSSCIQNCATDLRRSFYQNVIISGGTTLLPGLPKRLTKEMTSLIPLTMKFKVVAPPERKYSIWIGGSILASLPTFQQMWITKEEYEEHGAHIVHRKCVI